MFFQHTHVFLTVSVVWGTSGLLCILSRIHSGGDVLEREGEALPYSFRRCMWPGGSEGQFFGQVGGALFV